MVKKNRWPLLLALVAAVNFPYPSALESFAEPTEGRASLLPERLFVPEQRSSVFALTFSPDNTILASGGYNIEQRKVTGQIQLWDVETGQPRHSWASKDSVSALAFSPDGSVLASGGGGMVSPDPPGVIQLWDARTGHLRVTLKGHTKGIAGLLFSSDGGLLASSAEYDKEVRLWNTQAGVLQRTLSFNQVSTIDFSLAWSAQTRGPGYLTVAATRYREGEWDRDVRKPGTGLVELWDIERGQVQRTLSLEKSYVWKMALAPDGRIAAGEGGSASNRTVRLWDAQTGQVLGEVAVPEGEFTRCLLFSPDGTTLISGNSYKCPIWNWKIRLWDVKTGALTKIFEPTQDANFAQKPCSGDWIRAIAVSPNGQMLAVAGDHGEVHLWRLK
jgi:WD40 repeat protein